ncbi:HNH endonuclease [Vibrio phage 11895-B1]|uniref:HNH endonuclease n=1 Tax=Vibrio phage 11895-B1 TaxID=754075 RepID=UPI0002C1007F|nr:HNH endonuclease [Vibrio phage 11895-B1]AGH32210.1 tRNA nucleotidyltransferase [Vibrio phage 11895-B1]
MSRLDENKKVDNLVGEVFGKLQVISFAGMVGSGRNSQSSWNCLCSCGNTTIRKRSYLKNNCLTERSCGCVASKVRKKLLWGFGVNDLNTPTQQEVKHKSGKREVVWRCPFYQTWMSMIRRCYSKTFQDNHAIYYRGCTVCEEWKYFSNFKAWMETQNWEGKHLDKDLLIYGNKIYSPETCVFVTQEVNSFMTGSDKVRGEYPIGVHYDKSKNVFVAQCHNPITKLQEKLGEFSNPILAHKAWKDAKLKGAIYLANLESNKDIANYLIKRYTFEEDEVCQY